MNEHIRRTQAQRRSQSETALLTAAIDLIAAEGVSAVTFEALGRVGGFSRGLAGLRFGSKSKLIEAVLRHLHEEQEAIAAQQGLAQMPGLDAILAYVDLGLRDMARRNEGRAYFRLMSWSVAEAHESRADFAAMHGKVAARLGSWIAKGQQEKTIRAGIDPARMAITIGALMLGLSMQGLVDADAEAEPMRIAGLASLRASLAI